MMRGHGLEATKRWKRTRQGGVQRRRRVVTTARCTRTPQGRIRQHAVCYRWAPRQGPEQHPATYALSARTYYGVRGPAVSHWGSKASPRRAGGHPWRSSWCRPCSARGSRQPTESRRTMRTSTPKHRDCDVLHHGPHHLRVLREHVAQMAALHLQIALQTVHRHVHATPRLHQVSEEDVCVAAVVPNLAGSRGARADVFAHEPRTGRREQHSSRRVHDNGPTEHLISSADRAR